MKVTLGTTGTALALAAGVAYAQSSGGDFTMTDFTIDAGGGQSTGAGYDLRGTIAQHDATPAPSEGGGFSLSGGFWRVSAGVDLDLIFEDDFG